MAGRPDRLFCLNSGMRAQERGGTCDVTCVWWWWLLRRWREVFSSSSSSTSRGLVWLGLVLSFH